MSGGKKSGDLIFNEDFDKEPEKRPTAPPPSRPTAPPPSRPPPPPPVEVPTVEEEAVVPAVPTSSAPTQGETSDVVLDFTTSTAVPVTTGDIQPATDDPEAQLTQNTQEQQPERKSWFTLKPFQKFFDVDDKEVAVRLLHSSTGPLNASFNRNTAENPDLWGPFWIATTLIFLTVISSNLKSYTEHRRGPNKHDDWDGDYAIIGSASLMYYVYLFGVGLLLYLILRCSGSVMTLVQIWCIYGYSWTVMMPALLAIGLINLIPHGSLTSALTAIIAIAASMYSGGFLVRNFSSAAEGMGRKFVLLLVIFVVHLLPGCLIAFYFH